MNLRYPGQTTVTSLVPRILGALPEHDQYFELFCGTCQIFKRKNPVPSVLVDKNFEIVKASLDGFHNGSEYEYFQADVFDVLEEMASTAGFSGRELGPASFVYMDPPWRVSKMGNPKKLLYKFNLSDNDLARLLCLARRLPCKAAILHYRDEIFDDILNDWHRLDTRVSYRGRVCDVALYCNYDFRAVRTHLTNLAGKDRTDRQRIKRKVARWVKNFEGLPVYEQQVIFETLQKKYL